MQGCRRLPGARDVIDRESLNALLDLTPISRHPYTHVCARRAKTQTSKGVQGFYG